MPLYLGLDAATQGLTAIVIEIERDIRRVVFNRSLNFDRDLPEYETTAGMRRSVDGDLHPSPLMWADALDRMMGRLAAAAEIDVEGIHAIAGSASERGDDGIYQHLPDPETLNPSVPLATQLKPSSAIARRFDSLGAYFEAVIAGPDLRLAPYWRKRYALPAAAMVAWTDDSAARAIGSGIIRDGVVGVSFGANDTVIAPAAAVPGAWLITFRNGSLARELVRMEHGLDWDAVAQLLDRSPGNDGCVMLPWVELEITPAIAHAGVRRFGFNRDDTARNVRGLIEGQMMAMANHAASLSNMPIEKVMAAGGDAANPAILQVMANVFGADVYRLDNEPTAALGAALRAYHADRLAAGEPVSWQTVVSGFADPKPGHRVSPNPSHVTIYTELRKHYAMLERVHQDRRPIC